MLSDQLELADGPNSTDLLSAAVRPDRYLHIMFATSNGVVGMHVNAIEKGGGDGLTFGLWGQLRSGHLRGLAVSSVYDSGTRTGRLILHSANKK